MYLRTVFVSWRSHKDVFLCSKKGSMSHDFSYRTYSTMVASLHLKLDIGNMKNDIS